MSPSKIVICLEKLQSIANTWWLINILTVYSTTHYQSYVYPKWNHSNIHHFSLLVCALHILLKPESCKAKISGTELMLTLLWNVT